MRMEWLRASDNFPACWACFLIYDDRVDVLAITGSKQRIDHSNGAKGCAMALSERILMDLEMPVVDGWEATRRLKGDPQTRDIPIIALSAHALAGEREKALAAGCNEFDTKPVEFDRLVATMRRILAGLRCSQAAPLKS
jgi:two-component system, cell cycle response regulator DivK